MLLLH